MQLTPNFTGKCNNNTNLKSQYTEAATEGFVCKKCLKNFEKIHRETPLLEPLFNIEEEALAYVFSCKFYEIFKDTFLRNTSG